MSQNARRYWDANFRKEGNPNHITRHHVPPQHPDPGPVVIRIDERRHRAYHLLFNNARNIEDCIAILRRDWWPS